MEKRKHIIGKVQLKSELNITELGSIISEKILGGIVLDGLEKNIYDEIPAIFAKKGLLGLSVVLQGYKGVNNEIGYWFEIIPNFSENRPDAETETIDLSAYLVSLLKSKIQTSQIMIEDPR